METLLLCLVLLLGCCGLAMELLMVMLLWKVMNRERQTSEEPCTAAELPEEVESRRLAAEAQRLYEQGFVNLMRYDGSPGRKECEL